MRVAFSFRPAASAARRTAGAAVVTVAAVACSPPADHAAAGPASRVVSLSPAFTELLFSIGAGDRLVGRTAWCDTPAAALEVPSVGDGIAPNVEAILARAPDLVVFYRSAANSGAAQRLTDLGIPTLVLPMDGLDDVPAAARVLGEAAGVGPRADSLAHRFATQLDSARTARVEPRRRVLLLAWDAPPIVIGGGSFQNELVTLAGAVNVFADLSQPSAQVSLETIAARDPDLVLLLDGRGIPAWADRPEWQVVRAVRERRFGSVQGTAFARPTLRALDAVRTLRAVLDSVPS